mmetsp:Transcript_13044/g.9439  ORF Transcript_13044/g.9439 Transcript_13044/m.9439 type:complete len:84 (+) Transcript_13044:16-267(+)
MICKTKHTKSLQLSSCNKSQKGLPQCRIPLQASVAMFPSPTRAAIPEQKMAARFKWRGRLPTSPGCRSASVPSSPKTAYFQKV